jgi:predicted dinucleotide-binding enzyme
MKIATIGSGNIGGTLGRLWAEAGHQVMFSSRHPDQLKTLAAAAGRNTCQGSFQEAAAFADVLLLAIPLFAIREILPQIKELTTGKTAIDAMNFFEQRDAEVAEEVARFDGLSTSMVAARLPHARVVKAFNSVRVQDLRDRAHDPAARIVIPFAGDDDPSKKVVASLIREAGFDAWDLGRLEDSRPSQPGQPLFTKAGTAEELKKMLETA